MKKEEMKEIEEFFESLGIDDDMLGKMATSYAENFMIQGEETTNLGEIVNRAPESLLNLILENWEEETEESISRDKKEQVVYDLIIESFQKEFVFLDEEDLEIILKTMNGERLAPMQTAVLQENYCRKGWVFMFCEDNQCIFIVPDEIREIMKTGIEDEKTKTLFGLIMGVRLTLRACIHLFGVVEKKRVNQIALDRMFGYSHLSEKEEIDPTWLLKKVEEALEILCERKEGGFWCEEEWIISDEFENRRQYKQFLNQVSGQEYYMPEQEEIHLYAEDIVDRKNPYYKKMAQGLTRLMKNKVRADNLMVELEYMAVQDDIQVQDIMSLLFVRGIIFPNKKSEENFSVNCSEWIHTVRKWSNRGFTDKELGERKQKVSVAAAPERVLKDTQTAKPQKKIGRNDPCPCGSGKKYKKCCGK